MVNIYLYINCSRLTTITEHNMESAIQELIVYNRNLTVICKIPSTRLLVFINNKPLQEGVLGNLTIENGKTVPFITGINCFILCEPNTDNIDLPISHEILESIELLIDSNLSINKPIVPRTFPEIWKTNTTNHIPSYLISCKIDSTYNIEELKNLILSENLYCKSRRYWLDINTLEVRFGSKEELDKLEQLLKSYFVRPTYIEDILSKAFIPMHDSIYQYRFSDGKLKAKSMSSNEDKGIDKNVEDTFTDATDVDKIDSDRNSQGEEESTQHSNDKHNEEEEDKDKEIDNS